MSLLDEFTVMYRITVLVASMRYGNETARGRWALLYRRLTDLTEYSFPLQLVACAAAATQDLGCGSIYIMIMIQA
jgi:hypothetical protein